ncbi:hypothetical protein [Mycobacterium paraintracellulare]
MIVDYYPIVAVSGIVLCLLRLAMFLLWLVYGLLLVRLVGSDEASKIIESSGRWFPFKIPRQRGKRDSP